jgi:hypothetical protein
MGGTFLSLYTGDCNDDSAPLLGKSTYSLPSNDNHSEVADDGSTLIESLNQPRITTTPADPTLKKSSTEPTTQQIKHLLANANVYSCAQTLEIDGLVTLAGTKFSSFAHKSFCGRAFRGCSHRLGGGMPRQKWPRKVVNQELRIESIFVTSSVGARRMTKLRGLRVAWKACEESNCEQPRRTSIDWISKKPAGRRKQTGSI